MLIGTVYVLRPGHDESMERDVCTVVDTDDPHEFKRDAENYFVNDRPFRRGWRIEFGPIGKPWRKVGGTP